MTRIRSWHWGMAMFGVGIDFGGWLVSQEDPVSSATSELRRTFGLPPAHAPCNVLPQALPPGPDGKSKGVENRLFMRWALRMCERPALRTCERRPFESRPALASYHLSVGLS